MKFRFCIAPALIMLGVASCSQMKTKKHIPLVNPASTERTVHLYNFIQDIQGEYTLSGQHNFVGKGSDYTDQLEEITGKRAIVWGSDFSFCVEGENAMRFQHCGPANLPAIPWERFRAMRDSMALVDSTAPRPRFPREPQFLEITLDEARSRTIEEIKARHSEGHIITLMWHCCFPTDGECCEGSSIWAMENRPSPERWDELVTGGTELNDAWKEGADKIAGYLKQLQDEDIPVLWRPYHEMNGVWFWWCNHKGEEGFKRLWIMMYEYFTHHHKLNNLIWVWNTNAPRDIPGDEAWAYEDFFPGIEYVDILAADVYRNDYKQSHYDQLVALGEGKPVALGEVGEIPTEEVLQQQPEWTWFMPWGWILFLSNEPDKINQVYHSERVLTLDEVSVDQDGRYSVKTGNRSLMERDPQIIVEEFNHSINSRDIEGLSGLMSEDHTYIDRDGSTHGPKSSMVEGWTQFFAAFPDYRNTLESMVTEGSRVFVRGFAYWSEEEPFDPVIWSALVKGDQVAEWAIFEDTPENRKRFGL
jgi:mannan endo-1,4-beta-mannosidase